jgi:nitrogen regulatory protein PII
MKLIAANIKPFKLDDVRTALSQLGRIITISDVKTHSPPRAGAGSGAWGSEATTFVPQVKIEVVVPDEELDKVLEVIRNAAVTGHLGDGRIFVWSVERAVRISTGETEEAAL